MNAIASFILVFVLTASSLLAQNLRVIAPSTTDAAITTADEPHYVYLPQSTVVRNRLVVFFPGTGAIPQNYSQFLQYASTLGLHVIGLTYPNPVAVNTICSNTLDTTAVHGRRFLMAQTKVQISP
jgi:hypothetical protein